MTARTIEAWDIWKHHVGELPAPPGHAELGNWAAQYGLVVLERAIEKASYEDQLDASEDVLERVRVLLRWWKKIGWCSQ